MPPGAPDFTWVELSTKRGRKTPRPVILPHRFFEQYYHHRRDLFWERIACSSDACFNFWASVKDSRCRASSTIPGIEWHDFSDHPGNPRYWWCYSDEDLVGLLIDIAESCHVNTLAISTLYKWIWLHRTIAPSANAAYSKNAHTFEPKITNFADALACACSPSYLSPFHGVPWSVT